MTQNSLARLAVPSVVVLILFLAYSSQILLQGLDPGPLTQSQTIKFNILLLCLWISYARACLVSAGSIPAIGQPHDDNAAVTDTPHQDTQIAPRQRFCLKCNHPKAPRSHHCKICRRCIPKMDHHCPWTANCVSHYTLPHFTRFLFYAVTSMLYLAYLLYTPTAHLWSTRNLPSYLGPTASQLIHLLILQLVNSLTLFLVGITFLRTVYSISINVTTIESWEIERHDQLLRRQRVLGGYLHGPDGNQIRITRQEFPYDIGIWNNIVQGMGSANPLAWFWPLSRTPRTSGIVFETNGFEEEGETWPPPDPDRMPRRARVVDMKNAFVYGDEERSNEEEVRLFKARQKADFERRVGSFEVHRRKPFHERYSKHSGMGTAVGDDEHDSTDHVLDEHAADIDGAGDSGEEGWQDSGGNRLKDYGVDEDVEFFDQHNSTTPATLATPQRGRGGSEDDDVPLAELIRRRKNNTRTRNGGIAIN